MHQPFHTLRDLLRHAVTRFNTEGLFFGHGSSSAGSGSVAGAPQAGLLSPKLIAMLNGSTIDLREGGMGAHRELLRCLCSSNYAVRP